MFGHAPADAIADLPPPGVEHLLDEIVAADYVNHSPGTPDPPPGPAGLKPIVAHMRAAIPDLHYDILDMVVEGDKVAVFTRLTGTHSGALWGVAPQGAKLNVQQMQLECLRGGQIARHWRVTDTLTLMKQMRGES